MAEAEAEAECPITLNILFVCLGNSCRSVMAETVMRSLTAHLRPAWRIDSAGIADWNVGQPPEPRAIRVMAAQRPPLTTEHIGRQLTSEDFTQFDYILCMDYPNRDAVLETMPIEATARTELLGSYDFGRPEVIADPYFDEGMASFEFAFLKIERCCRNFMMSIARSVYRDEL